MQLNDILKSLENWAPASFQESYDNSRLIFGKREKEISKALVALDITEEVVKEAEGKEVDLIISHHPLVFSGIKSLTGKTDAERALIRAIQSDIAIYAIHTNLDNVASGVNAAIGEKLRIAKPKILAPKKDLLNKLVVFVPQTHYQGLVEALWAAGAGKIGNYDLCSFRSSGKGSFRPSLNSNPNLGQRNEYSEVDEFRLEVLVEKHLLSAVLQAMYEAHPYEEVAHEIYAIENRHQEVGSGMYGDLAEAIDAMTYIKEIKEKFGGMLRYTHLPTSKIQRIAWCGGSGSFLLNDAKRVGADLFLSSDFKYHQFFEADNEILIADIGHYENEQFTIALIAEHLRKKFPTFAVLLTENSTNPINYI